LESLIGLEKYALNKISRHIKYSHFEIAKKDGNKRPITAPYPFLKHIQRSLYNLLSRIEKPDWLISGSKGKCYIDNAKHHQRNESRYALTLDIKSFYPNCTRAYVFSFFSKTMKMEDDVAGLLSDILTYEKTIPQGSPTSQLLAYFAYEGMFEELHLLAQRHGCTFTAYVDDLSFSSKSPIDQQLLIGDVAFILGNNGHKLKWRKKKAYSKNDNKLFTGVIVDTGNQLKIPNNLHNKIRIGKEKLDAVGSMSDLERVAYKKQLYGRIISAKSIEPAKYTKLAMAVKQI
jgi:hypothetical protein